MTKPLPVEIVRPKRTREAVVGTVVGRIMELFLTAYLLMVLIPLFAPWNLGYWQAFAVSITVGILFPPRPILDTWSWKWSK